MLLLYYERLVFQQKNMIFMSIFLGEFLLMDLLLELPWQRESTLLSTNYQLIVRLR